MENNSILRSKLYNIQRLRYLISCGKTFLQRTYRNKQRLIPLTRDIQMAMIDFNGSKSNSNLSEISSCNTKSLTSFVKNELSTIFEDLHIKNGADGITEIYSTVNVPPATEDYEVKIQNLIVGDGNEEFEITVEEISEDKDRNKPSGERMQMLEQRIATLETRLNSMAQNIVKLDNIAVNTNNILCKMDTPIRGEQSNNSRVVKTDQVTADNIYDYTFYTIREYDMNVLNYKKSLQSIELNQKPEWNIDVKPMCINLPTVANKMKKLSMFLETNDICM